MAELQILADSNIPRAEQMFGQFGTVRRRPGQDISPADVQGVDVLLVRSVTPVGPDLLEGSSVRFVGSATIGTDHVDQAYLRTRDIEFAHAPGSNATSVADYVVAALLELARRSGASLQTRTVGIVGCGNIGGRLARRLPALGMTVLRNDPPLAEAAEAEGRSHEFVALEGLLDRADIVTLHVPLKTEGPHPTRHLADAAFFGRLRPGAWFLNTSRGAVVDERALRKARTHGPADAAVLDVWADEPTPDPSLIRTVDLATPHIAGYAYDGKVRGTAMLYEALCEHLGVEPRKDVVGAPRPASKDALRCHPPDARLSKNDWRHELGRQAYDICIDDASMRRLTELSPEDRKAAFTGLRAEYRRRREMRQHTLPRSAVPPQHVRAVEEGLTMHRAERPAEHRS